MMHSKKLSIISIYTTEYCFMDVFFHAVTCHPANWETASRLFVSLGIPALFSVSSSSSPSPLSLLFPSNYREKASPDNPPGKLIAAHILPFALGYLKKRRTLQPRFGTLYFEIFRI